MIEDLRRSEMGPESIRIVVSNLILLSCAIMNELGHNASEIFGPDFFAHRDQPRESIVQLEKLLNAFFQRLNTYIGAKRVSQNDIWWRKFDAISTSTTLRRLRLAWPSSIELARVT